MPVTIARATLKNSTGRLSWIAASCGNEYFGSSSAMMAIARYASSTPRAAPVMRK